MSEAIEPESNRNITTASAPSAAASYYKRLIASWREVVSILV